MSIEQIIEGYIQEPKLLEFAERLKGDPALRDSAQLFACVLVWYFARAAGLTVEQANAGFDSLGLGRTKCVN